MTRKIISAGILLMLLLFSGGTVSANGNTGGGDSGQTKFIYIADNRPPVVEIERGEGVHATALKTGDSGVVQGLKVLVIASAALLMLVIYYKEKEKGESDYEEN